MTGADTTAQMEKLQMLTMTVRYTRYALSMLAAVGFSIKFN
jgi:hypothetical protein